ncbi:hypothetical protein Q9L58_006506 [Maublancomyces gigas]|uniref:Uncharacterized protein n=1 Tax=Discina gigas TaxID=1032678 RepID=A0ABR3GF14_9PEZI
MDAYLTQETVQTTFNEFAHRLPGVNRDILRATFADLVSAISGPYTAALREAITKEVTERLRNDEEAQQTQILHQAQLHVVETRHELALDALGAEVAELENSLQEAVINHNFELEVIRAEIDCTLATQDEIIADLEMRIIDFRGEIDDLHISTASGLEAFAGRRGIGSGNHANMQSQTDNHQSEYGDLPRLILNTDHHDPLQLPMVERATDSRGSTVVDGGDDEAYNVIIYSSDTEEDTPSASESDEYPTSPMSYEGGVYVNSSTSMSEDVQWP